MRPEKSDDDNNLVGAGGKMSRPQGTICFDRSVDI